MKKFDLELSKEVYKKLKKYKKVIYVLPMSKFNLVDVNYSNSDLLIISLDKETHEFIITNKKQINKTDLFFCDILLLVKDVLLWILKLRLLINLMMKF